MTTVLFLVLPKLGETKIPVSSGTCKETGSVDLVHSLPKQVGL